MIFSMNLILWIIFGIIIGGISSMLDPERESSISTETVFLAIGGACVGGILASIVFGVNATGLSFPSQSIAILCALSMIVAQRIIKVVR